MPAVRIDQIQVGQVLERPVTNASGIVLMRSGTALTPGLIERLRDLGFDELHIRTLPTQGADGDAAAVEARFRGHEHNPLMMQLCDLLVRRSAGATGG
jgi:hypothetical protein